MENGSVKPLGSIGCIARLYWFVIGNLILIFLAIYTADRHVKFPSWVDAVFWAVAVSLLAVRYVDIKFMDGETTEGKPASMQDFRRYLLLMVVICLLVYGVVCFLR